MGLALSRFRMLDLSRQLPGPFCSTLLADLGMDVVVVAAPSDPMGVGISLLGRNKRSVTLNLKAPEGREIFRRLAREVDVVLEGGRPGGAKKLGIDYETLRAENPGLVYCSISGYGQSGPYRDRVGHDVNYLGFAGVIDLTGVADGPPTIPGVQIADIGGGALMATAGILAALLARETTGEGQYVDVGMMDGAVAWQVVNAFNWLVLGTPQGRGRTMLTGEFPCYALYETKDGRWLTVGALEPHFWRTLCRELAMPDLVEQQFADGAVRDEAFRRLRRRFKERTMAEWVAALADKDVCVGPVATVAEMMDDPQVRHREMVVAYDDAHGTRRLTLGNPLKLTATPPSLRTPPAEFGAHTDAVLSTLGYGREQIGSLRSRGVV